MVVVVVVVVVVEAEVRVLKLIRVDSLVVFSVAAVDSDVLVVDVVVETVVVAFVELPPGKIDISAQFKYNSSIIISKNYRSIFYLYF